MSQISLWATTVVLLITGISYFFTRWIAGSVRKEIAAGKIAKAELGDAKRRLRFLDAARKTIVPFGTFACVSILYIFR